jgi:hypothetical protein
VPSHILLCQDRENIKREKIVNIVYHHGHDTLPSQKATVIMRASGNGQTFHQQCRRYSGRNAQDKCHHHYKSENTEKVMFWNMKKKIKKINGERHQGEAA